MRHKMLFALLLFCLMTIPNLAQSRSIVWQRWDVIIDNVRTAENLFDVTEQYTIQFNGTFRFGNAVLAQENLDSIDNIRVSQDGRALQRNCSNNPGTYCVQNAVEGISLNYYFFAPITNDTENFEITYTVSGALRSYEGGDQLYWIGVTADKSGFPVLNSTITAEMASAPREGIDPVESYGAPAEIQVNGNRVIATASRRIEPNEYFALRIQYPHDPSMSPPAWQSGYDTQTAFDENVAPIIDLGSLALGMIIGFGGLFGVYYLWSSRGRDPKVGIVPQYLSELPAKLPPGVAGALIDEKVDIRDIMSTLMDLATRGYLVIEEDRRQGFLGIGAGSTFTFKRTDQPKDGLRSYERLLLNLLFPTDLERTLDSLTNKFYQHIPALQREIYQELVSEGFFVKDPEITRSLWGGMAVAVFFGSTFLGFGVFSLIETLPLSLLCLPFSVVGPAFALMMVSQFMPAKTQRGAEEAAKWRAFREYLINLEKYQSVEEAATQFETFLPYAVAFGIERSWTRRFRQVPNLPMPTWYYPRWRGGDWSRGYTPGTPLPRAGDLLPGELVTAGDGGLNDLAGGVSSGLDSLSDSLTGMLNSASRIMTSSPQQSSSGGRSWSGGGSRGGGSGGGSRGFG
ncbi:MAG: DUF2207 domain-containing protein [Anaerolineae bacterium]|nr:DUF2207 domain-containing protein [Anaerolineae bacterium]